MRKLKSLSIKLLSIFLSIILATLSFPLSVIAQNDITTTSEIGEPSNDNNVVELVDRRTENTKSFRLADGSFMVAQYDTAIHYLDENELWQDIENTLSVSGSEIVTSDARIKFAKKTTGNGNLFVLHDGNRKLSIALDGAIKKVTGKITNNESVPEEELTQLQKMTTLDKVSASVMYEEILSGIDLEYVIDGTNIKENIIVKEPQEAYSYLFTMSLNNLFAELTENGEILISDTWSGEAVYLIPSPVMWDAANVHSSAVMMELVDLGNGKYTLAVTADSAWINAEERVFPVTIDPPIYTTTETVQDWTVTGSVTDSTSTMLSVSSQSTAYWSHTSLPVLPSSAYITNAEFSMFCDIRTDMNGYVAVYDNMVSGGDYVDFQQIISYSSDGGVFGRYEWNITPIVKFWYDNQLGTGSLKFAPASDMTFTGTACFYSSEYTEVSYRTPRFCISYRDMKGLEDYRTYTSQSAGFAGSGSVNHATGNLVFSVPTLTTTDALMPFTPTLVYNSALANKAYTHGNAMTPYSTVYTPYGFKLNMQETLIKQTFYNAQGSAYYVFVLADSDGTEHYFLPATPPENVTLTDTQSYYEDEDGLLLYLIEDTSTALCTVTDSGKNVRTYSQMATSPAFCLTSIADKNGNKVTFTLDTAYRPTAVSLIPNGQTAIEQLKLAYDTSGKLYAVWNPTSGEGVILRYSGNNLASVTRAHGATDAATWSTFYTDGSATGVTADATAQYTYDSAGLLTSVTNQLSKYKLEYSYTGAKVTEITEWTLTDNDAMYGQQVSFVYGTSSTVIRTSGNDDMLGTADDLLTTYSFDSEGRTVSCYTTDVTRTQIYGASNGQYVGEDNEKAKNSLKSSVQTTQHSSNYLLNGSFEDGLDYWTSSGSNVSVLSNGGYAGVSYVRLSSHVDNTTSYIYQDVALDAGEYTLSLYYSTFQDQYLPIKVKVQSQSRSYTVTKSLARDEYSATYGYIFDSVSFTAAPSVSGGKETFRIYIETSNDPYETQYVYFDHLMLSKTTGAADYDWVTAGHFENTGVAPSTFWSVENSNETIRVVDSGDTAFGDVLEVDVPIGDEHFVRQTVYQADPVLQDAYDYSYQADKLYFTLSAWAKGTHQIYLPTSLFEMWIEIEYYTGNGNTVTQYLDESLCFDKGITDWQFVSGGFFTDPSKGLVNQITLVFVYCDNPGKAWLDNVSFVLDSGTTDYYGYGSNGLVNAYAGGKQRVAYQYTEYNDLSCMIVSDGTMYEYTYSSPGLLQNENYYRYTGTYNFLTHTFSNDNVFIPIYSKTYDFNTYGLCEELTVTAGSETMLSSTTYQITSGSHIFGVLLKQVDNLKKVTKYFYDENTGRLEAVIYPEGNGVWYDYDAIGNLELVLPATVDTTTTDGYTAITTGAKVDYAYDEAMRLGQITTGSTTYQFTYDEFGNTESISAGSHTLASYEYGTSNGKLSTLTYGNGLKVKYLYDALDRVEEIQYNIGTNGAYQTVYTYRYTSAGLLYAVTDHINSTTTMYQYNSSGQLIQSYVYNQYANNQYQSTIAYDDQSRMRQLLYTFDSTAPNSTTFQDFLVYDYYYDDVKGTLSEVEYLDYNAEVSAMPVYDFYGRVDYRSVTALIDNSAAFYNHVDYSYVTGVSDSGGTLQSGLISKVVSKVGASSSSITSTTTYQYTYDDNGNITQITNASGTVQNKYYYDDLGQLIREDNLAKNATYVYEYDSAGNITSKKTYAYTTGTLGTVQSTRLYSYTDSTWGDLLTKANDTLEYDEMGNPTLIGYYLDGAGYYMAGTELEWQGRQLMEYRGFLDEGDGNGRYYDMSTTLTFTYNADGIRTSKTVDGVKHEYLLNGSQILGERWTIEGVKYTLIYLYDENGSPTGLKYRTNAYAANEYDYFFFEKNLQGDIVAVYNASGTKIGSYIYDAWGVCNTSVTSGNTMLENSIVQSYNPFRYRGYYCDTQSGWYYLQSRYYNPYWGRFISADGYVSTGTGLLAHNMYAYCNIITVSTITNTLTQDKVLHTQNEIVSSTLSTSSTPPTQKAPVENTLVQIEIRDVTNEVNAALYSAALNATLLDTIAYNAPWYSRLGAELGLYKEFYSWVNHKADWDIKRAASWERTIGSTFPGFGTPIIYNGQVMTVEALGNYTYGYLGAAFGFSLEILLGGSYYAAGLPLKPGDLKNEFNDWRYVSQGYYAYYIDNFS